MSDRTGRSKGTGGDDDAFAERVARVLRTAEHFDDDFDRSLVSAIRAERPVDGGLVPRRRPLTRAWWRAPALRLSPLAGLALAASVAAVASLGTLGLASARRQSVQRAGQTIATQTTRDTITFVRFVFLGQAKSVSLVGDFNEWGATPVPLSATGADGAWTVSVPVPNGRHEYAFIVDGKRWVADPLAPPSADEFNTTSSIITVGT